MHFLDLTLDEPAANVALDEALLEWCEAGEFDAEILRVWEPYQNFVVIGRGSEVQREVAQDFCTQHRIPVIRRCSGGAAIVTGPGCLMYAVILDSELRQELTMIDTTHQFVLYQVARALRDLGLPVEPCGISDLAVDGRKVSGNSLRRKRRWLLYHGTLLCGLPGEMIQRCLDFAPRQPAYRGGRDHRDFVGGLEIGAREMKQALRQVWSANEPLEHWPQHRVRYLVKQRYSCDSWNLAR